MERKKDLFEQVERWLVVGLLTLAILLVFGSVAQRSQQQLALEPTSLLLPPTVTLEPYPPPIQMPLPTETPEPYPPPTHTPAPTISTPTVTTTPTPVPTPTALISGLKIVWVEAPLYNGARGTATVWMADVGDLATRTALCNIEDLPEGDQLALASLSPDGKKIAYVTEPRKRGRTPSESTPRVIDLSSKLQQVLSGPVHAYVPVDAYPMWSPDSRILAYAKLVPKSVLPMDEKEEDPYRPELHIIAADGSWDKALIAEDTERPALIGWSADGKILYSRFTRQGKELWTVDVAGNRGFITLMHTEPVYLHPQLSPDRQGIIFCTYSPLGIYEGLVYLSTDGQKRKNIDFNFEKPWNLGGWVSNDEIILHVGMAKYRIVNVNDGTQRDITVARPPGNTSYSLSPPTSRDPILSPDGQWLVLYNYHTGEVDLLRVNTEIRMPITDNWFVFLGWLTKGF